MARYVDGFVLPVPKRNLKSYARMAREAGKVWRKHGALEYLECVGDDLNPDMGPFKIATFPGKIKPKPGEAILFSFIVFKSRAHRDRVNAKVMKDPFMNDPKQKDKPMPFDVRRMLYGGFKVMVDL
ncbi:MAG: DUF1428 domain-containing protein [Ignavibacterium sp.]|jgi:uncharacterized protein YbaA (DUF1428 family)